MIPAIYNIRSLGVRKWTTGATLIGIALVVFVFSSVLMLSRGITKTLSSSGKPENAIVLRKGSDAELASGVQDAQVGQVLALGEVARAPAEAGGGAGSPIGVGEVVVVITLDKVGAPGFSNVTVRGTPAEVWQLRSDVKIIAGRKPAPGTDEVVIGKGIRGHLKGVELGGSFDLKKNRPVKVVGVFDAGGSSFDSEVWGDLDSVRSAFNRQGVVSSVRVRLTSPSKFDAFKLEIENDKTLGLDVTREDVYYEKQSEGLAKFMTYLGMVIAVFFSLGAMIGAAITMYSTIANRTKEIGTLRALGFSRFAILISFLFESLTLSLVGGAIGALASLLMSFKSFPLLNGASFSEIIFRFESSPGIMLAAMIFAGAMGIIGGFFPAVQAARMSPLKALRG